MKVVGYRQVIGCKGLVEILFDSLETTVPLETIHMNPDYTSIAAKYGLTSYELGRRVIHPFNQSLRVNNNGREGDIVCCFEQMSRCVFVNTTKKEYLQAADSVLKRT